MNLGDKLLELRKKKGLSQEEVAFELNVTRQTISKWETNQTTPDFDKIAPLCKLYEISTDELLTGKKTDEVVNNDIENKKSNALILSISIFLYFLAVILLIFTETVLKFNDGISVSIFLIICAIATCLIIYNSVSKGNSEQKKEEKTIKNKLQKQIEEIITSITLIIYLIVSFITMAWHITWILWIINVLICEIVKLVFILKGEEVNDEE